jgi:hypothetical protein
MGPTGTKTNIPNGGETIMIIGNNLAAADIRTVAPALRAAGNKVRGKSFLKKNICLEHIYWQLPTQK